MQQREAKSLFPAQAHLAPPPPPQPTPTPPALHGVPLPLPLPRLDSTRPVVPVSHVVLPLTRSTFGQVETSFSLSEEVAWSESKTQQPGGLTPIRSVSEYLVTKQVRRVLRFTAKVQSIVSTEVQTVARRLAH